MTFASTRSIVFTNHKGGAGKSTSATNIALGMVYLLRRANASNCRVLLIDTNSQAHASLVTTGRKDYGADDSLYSVLLAAGEQRYQQVGGGNIRGCLYLADRILPRTPLIITEGEFDALIAGQVGWDFARAAAIGSASHARIDRRWYGTLLGVPRVIACMDADAAGAGAAAQLEALSGAVKCVQVPLGKDLNEFYQQAGENGVKEWLQTMIDQAENGLHQTRNPQQMLFRCQQSRSYCRKIELSPSNQCT